MSEHKRLQFEQAARAWATKTGASVWRCDRGGAFSIHIDNPPPGFNATYSPEEFFRKIGGKFAKEPEKAAVQPPLLPPKFHSWNVEVSQLLFGSDCATVALAALLGKSLRKARELLGNARRVYLDEMAACINRAGYRCRVITGQYPSFGLAIIQHEAASAHWIAVNSGMVSDSFSGGWISPERYARKRHREYWVHSALEVSQ